MPALTRRAVCWVCGESHALADCPLWQFAIAENKRDHDSHAARLGLRQGRQGAGCILPADSVQTRDVPGDGDCMFHAFGLEVHARFPELLSHGGAEVRAPGRYWREYLVAFVTNPGSILDNQPVTEWVQTVADKSVADYTAYIRSQVRPWGGFFELCLLCAAWGRGLSCGVLQQTATGYRILGVCGATPSNRSHFVFLLWTGAHYMRARVVKQARQTIQEWEV